MQHDRQNVFSGKLKLKKKLLAYITHEAGIKSRMPKYIRTAQKYMCLEKNIAKYEENY